MLTIVLAALLLAAAVSLAVIESYQRGKTSATIDQRAIWASQRRRL